LAGHVACMAQIRSAYKILVGKPEGKRPTQDLGMNGDNIRIDIREMGWKVVDLMHLAQNRDHWQALVNTVMNLQLP